MSTDMEAIARALLSGQRGEKISANIEKISKILSTPQGKAMVTALTKDGGASLCKAAQDVQNGKIDAAKDVFSSVVSTKEGAEILRKIAEIAE